MKVVNAVKKINHHSSPVFLQLFTTFAFNLYWIQFIFTKNMIEVNESWPSSIRRCRHAGGKGSKTRYRSFFFVRIMRTRRIKIIHRSSPHSPPKDVRITRWKLFFFSAFHRISYENSQRNLDTGSKKCTARYSCLHERVSSIVLTILINIMTAISDFFLFSNLTIN